MGCCGGKRQQMVQKVYGSQGYSASAQDGMRGAPVGAVSATTGAVPATAGAAGAAAPVAAVGAVATQFAAPPGVPFVYDGVAPLLVTGGATGRRYRFAERGARVLVDPLDAAGMRHLPRLRCLV